MRVRRRLYLLAVPVVLVFGLLYLATLRPDWVPVIDLPFASRKTYELEVTDYKAPQPKAEEEWSTTSSARRTRRSSPT